jgi:hypothetical protein
VAARDRAGRVGSAQMGPTSHGPTGTGRSRHAVQGEPRQRVRGMARVRAMPARRCAQGRFPFRLTPL